MGKSKKNYKRVVLNLPPKIAATFEYMISVAQFARTKSDLVVQMLNDYVDKMQNTLNGNPSWQSFTKRSDLKKIAKVDAILDDYLSEANNDIESEEDE